MKEHMLWQHKISTNLKVALTAANKNVTSNKNFVCSPLGVEISLSILAAGSSGGTRKQILQFLGSESVTSIINKASRIMDLVSPDIDGKECKNRPLVSFITGAWVDSQFSLRSVFQELLKVTYKAEAKAVDFRRKDKVCKEVNLWANKESQGLIDEILSPQVLKQDSMLIIANALFFKAAWQRPLTFCKNRTFYLLSGDTIEAPFMSPSFTNHYYDGASFDTFRLLRIPYRRGEDQDVRNFSMYIFLPNARNGLVDLMQRFREDSSFLDKEFELEFVSLVSEFWIPKFKFFHEFSASDTLKQLGLDRMFKSLNELSRMVEEFSALPYVSEFRQKSFIEVNEEGTLATSVSLFLCGGGYCKSFSFVTDHPFMFMIREDTSGVTMFMGVVLNPLLD